MDNVLTGNSVCWYTEVHTIAIRFSKMKAAEINKNLNKTNKEKTQPQYSKILV